MTAWPSSIEIPTVPGGLPGQASSVTQKNTIPTANRPRMPPTAIASLIFADIAFPRSPIAVFPVPLLAPHLQDVLFPRGFLAGAPASLSPSAPLPSA